MEPRMTSPAVRVRRWLPLLLLVLPACQQQMASQPSIRPDEESHFFADGRGSRPVIPGTVARGHLRTDLPLYTGMRTRGRTAGWARLAQALMKEGAKAPGETVSAEEENYVDEFPFPITQKVLEHGYNRYMIYCVVCHDPLGTGRGKIVERGYTQPPSYHEERLRKVPVGHLYDVITRGYGSMPAYRAQIPPRDRWAIAAYVRVLQLSQHFPEKDLTRDQREMVQKAAAAEKKTGEGEP
jgi:mono/diheme cytochrome c family protein